MYFCEKRDASLPATCPTGNATGPRTNCSEGDYGYERFAENETGSRSYELELTRPLESGEHCLRFYYYLSDRNSNASVEVILEDERTMTNASIIRVSSMPLNRWQMVQETFDIVDANPKVLFASSVSRNEPSSAGLFQLSTNTCT